MEVAYLHYPLETPVRESATDLQKVIGILCNDDVIRTGIEAIKWVQLYNGYKQLITLAHAKFMDACDLGHQWRLLAACKPLFCVDGDEYFLTKDMLEKPE